MKPISCKYKPNRSVSQVLFFYIFSGVENKAGISGRSGFRIFVAVEGEVRAHVAEQSDPLPPLVKVRVMKAHRFADNRDQACAWLQSAQSASDVMGNINRVISRHSTARGTKGRIH